MTNIERMTAAEAIVSLCQRVWETEDINYLIVSNIIQKPNYR